MDSETRPMTNQEAHDVAVRIARQAVEMEVGVIYKKLTQHSEAMWEVNCPVYWRVQMTEEYTGCRHFRM